jgi:hypothetical protein
MISFVSDASILTERSPCLCGIEFSVINLRYDSPSRSAVLSLVCNDNFDGR